MRRLAARAARSRCPYARWVLWTTILASSMAFVDGSVVNVGLPAIQAGLRADPAALQWVINAYLLPLGALLLLGGAAGDRLGRKAVFIAGIAAFGAASALCAAAWNLPVLLLARTVQGIAAAFVLPNSLAILGTSFSGPARGRAIGFWAAAGAAVGAAGPMIGGWLIDVFGWRTVFMINLPLAAVSLAMAAVFVREAQPGSAPGAAGPVGQHACDRRPGRRDLGADRGLRERGVDRARPGSCCWRAWRSWPGS